MTTAQAAPAVVHWTEPEGVTPRGTLLVVPGRGEHAGLYARFGRRLGVDGYRVTVVPDPLTEREAAAARLRDLLAAAGPGPRVLVGSDTGALFAAGLVAGGLGGVEALVLAGLPAGDPHLAAGWEGELDARTACPVHRGLLEADPAVRRGALADEIPAEWLRRADAACIAVPVLGLHGTADPVAPLDTVRDWYSALGRAELVGIVGGRHDALNDQTHRTAAATVVQFLERLRAGVPAIARVELVRGGTR